MYRVVTNITFTQQPTADFPNRKSVLHFDFVAEYEASDSWADLTNKAKITIPKNVYVRNGEGKLQSLSGKGVNIGGFSTDSPVFLRGDKVIIEGGYRFTERLGNEILLTSVLFTGYISQVTSKMPMVIECEDNMWKLKQTPAVGGNGNFFSGKKYTLESMMRELITNAKLPFTVNVLTNTSIGDYSVANLSIAQVLDDLNKKYSLKAYFRGSELRIGALVYVEQDNIVNGRPVVKKFIFQQNIISDELEYRRKDDLLLSAIAKVIDTVPTDRKTKDGHTKTKKQRKEVLVTYRNGKIQVFHKTGTEGFPANIEGERREFNYLPPKTEAELEQLAKDQLARYYYTGFKGKFTTFGIPYVRQGDNVSILDPILPERNGIYKVKSVAYSGGMSGMRQVIELDYRITGS